MTSNKKFITLLLFVGALTLTVLSAFVSMSLAGVSDLERIIAITQYAANLGFIASLLTLSVTMLLISDMN